MLISLIAFTEWHWLAQKLSLIERENVSELFLISPDESSMIGFFASLRFQAHKIVGQDDFICACVLLAAYTLVFGGFNSGCRSRTFKHSRPFRWLVIQPTTQTACFSQSVTTASPSSRVTLCVVATNSGTERYESSLVCLLTEDILSLLSTLLPLPSFLFASLCVSSLPPQLCFGVGWFLSFLLCLSSSSLDLRFELRKQSSC